MRTRNLILLNNSVLETNTSILGALFHSVDAFSPWLLFNCTARAILKDKLVDTIQGYRAAFKLAQQANNLLEQIEPEAGATQEPEPSPEPSPEPEPAPETAGSIPGYPLEGILIGILVAMILLYFSARSHSS